MKKFRFGIVVYPGTNCDQDTGYVLENVLGQEVRYVFHKESDLSGIDCIVLPGGFSYGDYLRTGAIARVSPVMEAVRNFVEGGGAVIGICNGFQILCEAGLLPGAFLQNSVLEFRCQWVYIRTENNKTVFTDQLQDKEVLEIPIAHREGNYYCDDETLTRLKENKQIVFRYCDKWGRATEVSNPNGSRFGIAGIINEHGNVFGMMPHPERASEEILGGNNGRRIWESIILFLEGRLDGQSRDIRRTFE